jgi:iron-sulfur cluster repair protein YtfE (RIC family)
MRGFKHVDFSKKTAKRNPGMILREYKRLENEAIKTINEAKKKLENVSLEFEVMDAIQAVENQGRFDEKGVLRFSAKLEAVKIKVIEKKEQPYHQDRHDVFVKGVDALNKISKIFTAKSKVLEDATKLLTSITEEREKFKIKFNIH